MIVIEILEEELGIRVSSNVDMERRLGVTKFIFLLVFVYFCKPENRRQPIH